MVVETMRREHLGYNEAMRVFGITAHGQIQKWERIYLTEGPGGLAEERRGRANAASGTQKGRPAKMSKQVEEDLLSEVQRLRAENAYLKNLQALVLEDELHQRKRRW